MFSDKKYVRKHPSDKIPLVSALYYFTREKGISFFPLFLLIYLLINFLDITFVTNLLAYGADPNVRYEIDNSTPLMYAVSNNFDNKFISEFIGNKAIYGKLDISIFFYLHLKLFVWPFWIHYWKQEWA